MIMSSLPTYANVTVKTHTHTGITCFIRGPLSQVIQLSADEDEMVIKYSWTIGHC